VNNRGRFTLREADVVNMTDEVMAIQARVAILETRTMYIHSSIEFLAVGPDFRPIEPGELIPEYRPIFTSDPRGAIVHVEFVEVAQ
tara:strand:- start:220 stop:477 length:258 start_codon:yes stop_codon:yes gene_type:complete